MHVIGQVGLHFTQCTCTLMYSQKGVHDGEQDSAWLSTVRVTVHWRYTAVKILADKPSTGGKCQQRLEVRQPMQLEPKVRQLSGKGAVHIIRMLTTKLAVPCN